MIPEFSNEFFQGERDATMARIHEPGTTIVHEKTRMGLPLSNTKLEHRHYLQNLTTITVLVV